MTEKEIRILIAAAGLSDVVSVFLSAIEIHDALRPDGQFWDGYSVLTALLSTYAAQVRKEERERGAAIAHERAMQWDRLIKDDQTGMAKPRYLEACDIAALIVFPPTPE